MMMDLQSYEKDWQREPVRAYSEGLMAFKEGDPGALRRNVLHLLLQHPQGVSFGDFAGAFYQLHGYHPHISLNGYHSLKDLVADMKNVVVVEGDSTRAVMKIANGFHLDHWLGGGEENGLDYSEGEAQSLTDEEKASGDADDSTPSTSGSKQDLVKEPARQAPDLLVALAPIRDVLECHPHGLKVVKLKKALREHHGFDLETFRSKLGYKDVKSCLQDVPGLLLPNSNKTGNCVVQLQSRPCSPAPSLDTDFSTSSSNTFPQGFTRKKSGSCSPTPSLDSGFSASNANAVPQSLIAKKSDLAAALVLILEVLGGHPLGLNVKVLKENLEKKYGFDLEIFSQDSGYEDVVACLLDVPGLSFSFTNGKWPHNCVVQLLSGSLGPPPKPLSAGPSLDKPLSSSGSNVSSHELMETKLASHNSTPSQFSTSLSLDSEQSTSKPKPLDQNVLEKKPTSCSSTPSQCSSSPSLDSEQLASKSKTLKQNILGKTPVLTEVLDLVTSLLTKYKEGLRVTKVKEFLLATERIDLEQFSIAQGHKDTLEFLECRMPMLNIKYRENRLNCVVQEKGKPKRKRHRTKAQKETTKNCFGDVSKPSFTFGDFSAGKFQIQNLPVPAAFVSPQVENWLHTSTGTPPATVPNLSSFPVLRCPLVVNNSSLSPSVIPPRWPSVRPFGGPRPAEKVPCLLDAQLPSESSLTKPWPPKDLDELKQQVAHILATHPEGMSLFQFRAAYSAAYQQHLPLGNACSAKQRLQEMPDVVCLQGYGVQTLLLPVSSEVCPVKSGQPVFSKAENAAMLPGPSLPKTVAAVKPVAALKPSFPKVPVAPEPRPICDRLGEPDNNVLPEGQSPRAPQIVDPLQEHVGPSVNLSYHLGPPDLSKVKEATDVPGHSLPNTDPVVAPKSCLKPSHQKLPVPQPCLPVFQASECPGVPPDKDSLPLPVPRLQRAPKPIASVQEQVRTSSKAVWVPFSPHSPVIFPLDSQPTRWGENVKPCGLGSQPTYLPSPRISGSSSPAPSIPQPVPANFAAWAQPVVYPPVTFLPEIAEIPPLYPAPFLSVSGKPSQTRQTLLQSSHWAPSVSPRKLVQPMSPIRSTDQRNHVHTVPGLDLFSQGQRQSRTLQHAQSPAPVTSAGTLPVSSPSGNSPSRNSASNCLHKSQTVHQPECYNHTWLDGLQRSSVPVPDKSLMFTPLDRIPSKPPASMYRRQYDDVNSALTSPSTLSFSSQSPPAGASLRPTSASSGINSNSDVPFSDPLVCQQQYPSRSAAVTSSSAKPICSPLSPVDSTISPSCQRPCASPSIHSNFDASPSDPSPFMHQWQYTSGSTAVTTSSTRPANSLPSPLDTTTSPSRQLLFASSIDSNSDGLPSEPRAFMHQQQHASSVSTAITSSTKPAHSPPSLQDSIADPSRQPYCAPLSVSVDYDTPSRAHLVPTISKPADNSCVSLSEKQIPYYSAPRKSSRPQSSDRCVIL